MRSVFTSTLTRAQVQADYVQAAKAGQISPSIEGTTLKVPTFVSTRSHRSKCALKP